MTRRFTLLALFLFGMTIPAVPQDDPGLTPGEIVFLVELGKNDAEIIDHIEAHRLRFETSPETEDALRRRGVAERIIRVIREVDLVDRAISMKDAGKDELDILQVIADRAVQVSLSTGEALRLRRKGLSIDVIRALKGDRRFRDFRTHSHPGGFFQLQHPKEWVRMEEMRNDQLVVAFTPEKGKASVKSLDVSVQIHAQVVGRQSPYSYLSLDKINAEMIRMRALRKKVKGQYFKIIEPGKRISIHGIGAILADTEYQRKGPVLRRWGILLFYNGIEYLVLMDAPADRFEKWEPVFRKILLSFTPSPGKLGSHVRREMIEPREVLKKYRASVVKVNCGWNVGKVGWVWMRGTGFFVRRDGYLLTNHHVVWLDSWYGRKVRRHPDRITIDWDQRLNRPTVDVKLIDAVRTNYPHVDIALLKAAGSDHTPMPLTRVFPPGKWVREQDSLLTLGFPAVVEMERKMAVTLTTTLGTLSKFNLLPDGTVDDIISDAVIHGGNSGGPMFNLETRSVIGLNTVTPVDSRARTVRTYYSGVVPIDRALEVFPEIVAYPLNGAVKFRPRDYLSLAIQFLRQGLHKPALRQIGYSLEGNAGYAAAHAVAGDIHVAMKDPATARRNYEKALALEENHVRALIGLARLLPNRAHHYYSRVIGADPKNHEALTARARVLLSEGKRGEALRDAKEAVKWAGELYAEPHCVLGAAMYAMKMYEEGRERYETAMEIDPHSAEARFGLVEYHEYLRQFDRALAEVEKVVEEARDQPLWLERAGDTCYSLGLEFERENRADRAKACWERAFLIYDEAARLYVQRGLKPGRDMLLKYGWLAHSVKKDHPRAEKVYALLTNQLIEFRTGEKRENDASLQSVYVNLGQVYGELKKPAIAEGFFQAAVNLDASGDLGELAKKELKGKRTKLAGNEIDHLIRRRFNAYAIADVILASPLAFSITQKEALNLQKAGTHPVIIEALLEASRGKARDLKDILADWRKRDAALIRLAEKLPFEERNLLFEKWYQEHDRKNWSVSIPGFKKVFYRCAEEDRPLAVIAAYNVACAYSLQKMKSDALDWLELSVYCGLFEDERDMVSHMQKDADLVSIRGEKRYEKIVEAGQKYRDGRTGAGKASLGAALRNLTGAERARVTLKAGVGVIVTKVDPAGGAAKAGLAAGDIICRMDDDVVGDAVAVSEEIAKKRPGTKVAVTYLRDSEFGKVDVILGRAAK